MDRLQEILILAQSGDEDVELLVASEIALMPESREQLLERAAAVEDAYADTFAPPPEVVSQDELARLAEEADF